MLFKKFISCGLIIIGLFLLSLQFVAIDADARMGGGRSRGSSGFRSFSAPRSPYSSPYSSPASPSRSPASPFQQRQGGGFLRGMAGGIVGGMLGGMLFRSLGMSGFGGMGGGGGIGIFEILLIGLIGYGIWRYMANRKREATDPAAFNYNRDAAPNYSPQPHAYSSEYQPGQETDVETALGQIRRMDPTFDEQNFKDACMDIFFKVQGAWANRDMTTVRHFFTAEMYGIIQGDAEDLKRRKQINRLDNIAVRSTDITAARQEAGNDFIAVRLYANLLDYTLDETTGQVLSGSKTEPVKFVEFWTFTRPVGNNPWQLTAIAQE